MKLVLFFVTAASMCFGAATADLFLINGKIVTVDSRFSIHQAVAAKDGRIVAVGTNAEILRLEHSPHAQTIDLKGRTVLPGLIDAHVHALSAGESEYRAPLPALHSFADIQTFLRAEAKRTPKGAWIIVPRTFPTRLAEMRMPTREVLDVVNDHPVLYDASYVSVLNSFALKLLGITRKTANPPRGLIAKDAHGEPNGILRNADSLLVGVPLTPVFTQAEKQDALAKMLRRYVEGGLTTIGDRAVIQEDVELYEQLKAQGHLPIRAVLTWRLNASRPVEQVTRDIEQSPWVTNKGDEWLKFGAFKVTLDGGMTIGTAYQRQPYGAFGKQLYGLVDPADQGQLFIPPDKLRTIMQTALNRGWQITAHSQGGGALDVLLSTFESLNTHGQIASTRSHFIHGSFQSPESIRRIAKLQGLADMQPDWLYFDGPALTKVFGDAGMRYFIPLRSLIDAGVIIAGGSDHMIGFDKNRAVNAWNPFLEMWIAITRRTIQGTVIHPEERISRQEALKMYSAWPAYLQFSEKKVGSIEPGKLADMVVIDRDYLTCPEDQIRSIEPLITVLNGKVVYSAPVSIQ